MIIDLRSPAVDHLVPEYPLGADAAAANEFDQSEGPTCHSATVRYADPAENDQPYPWIGMVIVIGLIGWVALAAVVALMVRAA